MLPRGAPLLPVPGEPLVSHPPPQTLVASDLRIDPFRFEPGRSNKRKSEEVNGEVKQEVMSVEKEEEELEEKVRASAGGGRGLGRLLCRVERVGLEGVVLSGLPLHPFLSPSRNKMRKGLKSKPKKGKEEGERSLLWVPVGARFPPLWPR